MEKVEKGTKFKVTPINFMYVVLRLFQIDLPFSEMNNGVHKTVTADVTPPSGVVTIPARLFCHIETSDEWSHRLTPFADFDEHVAVDFGQGIPVVRRIDKCK